MARDYARGRVLDAFSYNGGFGLQVAAQADEVLAVDVSADAIARVQRERGAQRHHERAASQEANVFDVLHELDASGRALRHRDPRPARLRQEQGRGGEGAPRLQGDQPPRAALLEPGRLLITCSCSYHVHEADLEAILASAAVDAGPRSPWSGEAPPGPRPPGAARRARDLLPEVLRAAEAAAGEPAVTSSEPTLNSSRGNRSWLRSPSAAAGRSASRAVRQRLRQLARVVRAQVGASPPASAARARQAATSSAIGSLDCRRAAGPAASRPRGGSAAEAGGHARGLGAHAHMRPPGRRRRAQSRKNSTE